jgi:hypothetical protein
LENVRITVHSASRLITICHCEYIVGAAGVGKAKKKSATEERLMPSI